MTVGLVCVTILGCGNNPEPLSFGANQELAPVRHVYTHPVIVAGADCGLVEYGEENSALTYLAEQHADSMASRQHQDHKGWERRYSCIIGATEASEICAESWPGKSKEEAAAGCWEDWRQSPSHWRTANGKPKWYGVAMSQGRNGIWYVCIIAVWE